LLLLLLLLVIVSASVGPGLARVHVKRHVDAARAVFDDGRRA
jgi:membrane protein required for beta-lactamase induction